MNGFRFASLAVAVAVVGCASGGPSPEPSGPAPSTSMPASTNPAAVWPVRTAEYVDVWLHSYAMVSTDTIKVPLFARNYRTQKNKVRTDRNVTTALDANRSKLEQGIASSPDL